MAKQRKIVSLRVADHPEKEIINQWLDQQNNIQDSLTNVILHIIDQFGMRNITDFEVQKAIYQRVALTQSTPTIIQPTQPVISNPVVQEAPVIEPPHVINNEENNPPAKEEKAVIEEESSVDLVNQADPDDPYAFVDVNNL